MHQSSKMSTTTYLQNMCAFSENLMHHAWEDVYSNHNIIYDTDFINASVFT
jgi:hypothetical protein